MSDSFAFCFFAGSVAVAESSSLERCVSGNTSSSLLKNYIIIQGTADRLHSIRSSSVFYQELFLYFMQLQNTG